MRSFTFRCKSYDAASELASAAFNAGLDPYRVSNNVTIKTEEASISGQYAKARGTHGMVNLCSSDNVLSLD